ncbi:hypothetical protein RUND412_002065 [Rhizina undulata]
MAFQRVPVFELFSPPTRNLVRMAQDGSSIGTETRVFSPNFDVRETSESYILDGELPGIEDKSKIDIEFTGPQTLEIRGRIERSYKQSSEHDRLHGQTTVQGTTAGGEMLLKNDVVEFPLTAANTAAIKSPTRTNVASIASVNVPSGVGTKYWVTERTVGEFQRSFSFPGKIDIDATKASLQNGILKIVVPKKNSGQARRIDIE